MVTYSNDSNTYALTVSELLSWDYRTYRFGTSYSYYYCEPTSEMPIGTRKSSSSGTSPRTW